MPQFDAISSLGQLLNPNALAANIDANGNVINNQPLQKPAWYTRLIRPDTASYIDQQNLNYKLAPGLASQQESLAKDIFTKNVYANNPQLQQQYPNPDEAWAKFAGNRSVNSTQLNPVAAGESFYDQGGPRNTGLMQNQASLNSLRGLTTDALLGTPSAEAFNRNT